MNKSATEVVVHTLRSADKGPCKVPGCKCEDFQESIVSTERVCGHGYEKHC